MSDKHIPLARRLIKRHEGFVAVVYDDATGEPIRKGSIVHGVPSVGFGRNLQDVGITEDEGHALFERDLFIGEAAGFRAVGPAVWSKLNAPRRAVLTDMGFNLGASRLAKFKKMIAALGNDDFERAAREMLDSKWADDVGNRARTLAEIMRTGEMPDASHR